MQDTNQGRRTFLKAGLSATAVGAGGLSLPAFSEEAMRLAETQAMPVRALGRTGHEVPIIHLGTSQRLDPKYDKVMKRVVSARQKINNMIKTKSGGEPLDLDSDDLTALEAYISTLK